MNKYRLASHATIAVAIVAGSWLVADAASSVLEASASRGQSEDPVGGLTVPPPLPRTLDHSVIVARNIFHSSSSPIAPLDVPVALNRCSLPVRVLATVTVVSDPALSLATVRTTDAIPPTHNVYVGDYLTDGVPVIRIRQEQVVVLVAGEPCELGIQGELVNETVVVNTGSRTPKVRVAGATRFVPSALVDTVTKDLSSIAKDVKIVPAKDGFFKLYAIRPGTLFDELGFRNGDVIRRVNGHPLNSPEIALQLYASLKTESKFEIDIHRSNHPKTLKYEIQ